jgi:hypothetical protein
LLGFPPRPRLLVPFPAPGRGPLDQKIDAPFDLARRSLPAASEILVVLDFELTDVFFDLAQIFVNGRHARRELRTSMLGWPGETVNQRAKECFECDTA